MNDLEMHLRKVLEMSKFRLSGGYKYLSPASKVKFKNKHIYHAREFAKLFYNKVIQIFADLFENIISVFNGILNLLQKGDVTQWMIKN